MRTTVFMMAIGLLLPRFMLAQGTGRISGTVTDAQNKQHLEGATISVLNQKTGLYINHGVSNKSGSFQVGGLPEGQALQVTISFTGYRDTASVVILEPKARMRNTGVWKLQVGADELDSVTVTFHRPPFVVKKDTLEFDARAFKSLPEDMVQDLLRKIPGMTVDDQGNVMVNGRKVNKILVDGREFFSNNVTTALENLPGSVIDKIQVTDTRERGTGNNSIIKPITESVTLNLTLKKENKKGIFGDANAGAGTLDRYTAGAFVNQINNAKRETVFANTSNIMPEHRPGGGSGILQNLTNGGLSTAYSLGHTGTLDMNYATDNTRTTSSTLTKQANILPDSTFGYTSSVQSTTSTQNHHLNADYVNKIDTLQTLTVSPSLTYTNNRSGTISDARSTTVKGDLINTQQNTAVNRDRSWALGNNMTYSRASTDRKTNLNINWEFNYSNNTGNLTNKSLNKYFNDSLNTADSLDQVNSIKGNGISNSVSINVSRALTNHFTAIVSYAFQQSADLYNKDSYDYDGMTGKHDLLDSLYSVHNRNTSITNVPTASIGYHAGKLSIELGAGMRFIHQENHILWKDSSVVINQQNFSPRLSTSYQFARYMQWINNYSVEANAPSPEQLAPVQDNTNPLFIKVGNPYLRSAITHNISTELRTFSRDYRWHSELRATAVISNNSIVEDTYYDSLGRQVSTSENTSGNYQLSGNLSGGMRIKINQWVLNLDCSADMSSSQSNGFINQEANRTVTTSTAPQVNVGLEYKQLLSLQTNVQINYNSTHYSLAGIPDADYNTKTAVLFFHLRPVKHLVVTGTGVYSYNSQLPDDFQKSKTLLNTSVGYNFMKGEKLQVSFSVNDILNENVNVTRSVTPTAIQNTQVDALKRYAMVNVRYRFNSFNTKI